MPPETLWPAAGDLRQRITIKQEVVSYDEYNNPVVPGTWQAIQQNGKFWASVEPLSGREIILAKEIAPTATHLVTMRYVSGITDKMRVYFGDEVFDINAFVDVLKRHVKLKLYVTEVQGAS